MISQGLGVTAAAKWIQDTFESYSKACGGCLQVKTDSFTQPVAARVPSPTPLTNVYAVLPGTDPQNAKRIYLVTGHYDSRNSDTLNTKDAAPGATARTHRTPPQARPTACQQAPTRRRATAVVRRDARLHRFHS